LLQKYRRSEELGRIEYASSVPLFHSMGAAVLVGAPSSVYRSCRSPPPRYTLPFFLPFCLLVLPIIILFAVSSSISFLCAAV